MRLRGLLVAVEKTSVCDGKDCYLRLKWLLVTVHLDCFRRYIKKNMQIQSLASACQRIMLTYVFYYKVVIDDITIVTKSNNIIFTLIYQKLLT